MEAILRNAELMEKLSGIETAEELVKVLEEQGVALEPGVDAQQFLNAMKNPVESDELGEDDLDNVSGGVVPVIAGGIALGIGAAYTIAKLLKKKK